MNFPMTLCLHQLLLLAGAFLALCTSGQVSQVGSLPAPSGPRVQGLIYYAVEDRAQQQVVRRGTAGSAGVAFAQLILAPNTGYRIWMLEAATLRVAEVTLTTPDNGRSFRIPPFAFQQQSSHDADGDDLPDLGEFIMGTNGRERDTDGDGIADGAEVRQGTDPLSGLAVRTGIVGSAIIPGTAFDVCAVDDLAIVAARDRGISVLNIFNGMSPALIAQVDTPGDAVSVACSRNLIAVADGAAGLAIIDISDPPNESIRAQLNLGDVRAVTAVGSMAYVGLRNGLLIAVELNSGAEQQRMVLAGAIYDLFAAGDHLFVIAGNRLYAFRLAAGVIEPVSDVALSALAEDSVTARKRLFVGGGFAYASNANGYDTVDVTNPAAMRIIGRAVTGGPSSFKQIVLNGSGLGFAAVGVQPRGNEQDVSLYRTANPTNTSDFVTTFSTPGVAHAVAIYNGIGYVADGLSGLQVVNYLAFDNLKQAPSISLATSATDGRAEEGQFLRVTAQVSDDVQVRNVEFYLDGQKLVTDGNFPFEQRILLPLRVGARETVRIRARASDTGGNLTWSDEVVLTLQPDASAPRVGRTIPAPSALSGTISALFAAFNEPVVAETISTASFRLTHAGADGVFGTGDDSPVTGGVTSYQETLNAAVLQFVSALPPGNYRASLGPPIADRAGNVMPDTFSWSFRVFDRVDNDRDGVPDELEPTLGLDPTKTDTNGNGVPDGAEDPDRDLLPTSWEVFHGYDPIKVDSDANTIQDGREDPDGDFLLNLDEFKNGTDPRNADTDNDGWSDEIEVSGGSDPLNPASKPRLFVVSRPPVTVASLRLVGAIPAGAFVARPPVQIYNQSLNAPGALSAGAVVGRPPVDVIRMSVEANLQEKGTTVARPPVEIQIGP